MNIDDLRQYKIKEAMTNEQIAELSGIPLEIVAKIFSGEIENPNYMTLLAIEQVLVCKEKIPFYYNREKGQPDLIREEAVAYNFNARQYNMADVDKLRVGMRVELIDGKVYFMATPSRMHQFLITKILVRIENFIESKKGKCHVYTAPFGVRLFSDDRTWVEPDIVVVCKKEILTDGGCDGAPDIVVEIVSPSNAFHDYVTKLIKYQQAGVREYWIVDVEKETISLVDFEDVEKSKEYSFEEAVRSGVLDGFDICMADFMDEF